MNRCCFLFPGRAGLVACALGMIALPTTGQVTPEPGPLTPAQGAPANFDPSDVYFQAWLLSRDAETLHAEKRHSEALEKLLRARQLFDSVSAYFPLWKPEMVKGRREKTQETIDIVAPIALEERKAKDLSLAELEGGTNVGAETGLANRMNPGLPPAASVEADTLEGRRIAELDARVKELEAELLADRPASSSGDPNRDASRLRDMAKQRDLARAELQRAQEELRRLRSRFEAEPMQQELRNLANQLQAKDRERAAISQALAQSQQETRDVKAQAEALNVERGRLAQKAADLERNLEQERKLQAEVIAGQQRQLRDLQEQLRSKNDELAKANQRIAGLEIQLSQMKASYDELREERDGLLRERDQMAALLKLNEGSQIEELINQNMGLAKQLREANERVERLNKDHNATQDQLLEAMRDLAIAKGNINNFKREKAAQDKRIAELESRLRSEVSGLATRGGDPAEAEMLRGIIQKQLRIQERRRQATEMLIDALGEMAENDAKVKGALKLMDGNEMALTPKELDLVKDRRVDDEFIAPFRRSQGEVDASIAELEGGNRPFVEAISRAFLANRFESSRELSEMVLEKNPGDTATMCRLGVIQLRLENPREAAQAFRNATVIESSNPYAHRMLGYCLMETGEYGEALEALKRSVDLAPTNADTRIILGKVQFELGDEEGAERELKSAIDFDDALPEPYFNLAYLYAKQGKKELGRKYYQGAMERGAEADLDLEQRLAK